MKALEGTDFETGTQSIGLTQGTHVPTGKQITVTPEQFERTGQEFRRKEEIRKQTQQARQIRERISLEPEGTEFIIPASGGQTVTREEALGQVSLIEAELEKAKTSRPKYQPVLTKGQEGFGLSLTGLTMEGLRIGREAGLPFSETSPGVGFVSFFEGMFRTPVTAIPTTESVIYNPLPFKPISTHLAGQEWKPPAKGSFESALGGYWKDPRMLEEIYPEVKAGSKLAMFTAITKAGGKTLEQIETAYNLKNLKVIEPEVVSVKKGKGFFEVVSKADVSEAFPFTDPNAYEIVQKSLVRTKPIPLITELGFTDDLITGGTARASRLIKDIGGVSSGYGTSSLVRTSAITGGQSILSTTPFVIPETYSARLMKQSTKTGYDQLLAIDSSKFKGLSVQRIRSEGLPFETGEFTGLIRGAGGTVGVSDDLLIKSKELFIDSLKWNPKDFFIKGISQPSTGLIDYAGVPKGGYGWLRTKELSKAVAIQGFSQGIKQPVLSTSFTDPLLIAGINSLQGIKSFGGVSLREERGLGFGIDFIKSLSKKSSPMIDELTLIDVTPRTTTRTRKASKRRQAPLTSPLIDYGLMEKEMLTPKTTIKEAVKTASPIRGFGFAPFESFSYGQPPLPPIELPELTLGFKKTKGRKVKHKRKFKYIEDFESMIRGIGGGTGKLKIFTGFEPRRKVTRRVIKKKVKRKVKRTRKKKGIMEKLFGF